MVNDLNHVWLMDVDGVFTNYEWMALITIYG